MGELCLLLFAMGRVIILVAVHVGCSQHQQAVDMFTLPY
jgi:hypothetical protein